MCCVCAIRHIKFTFADNQPRYVAIAAYLFEPEPRVLGSLAAKPMSVVKDFDWGSNGALSLVLPQTLRYETRSTIFDLDFFRGAIRCRYLAFQEAASCCAGRGFRAEARFYDCSLPLSTGRSMLVSPNLPAGWTEKLNLCYARLLLFAVGCTSFNVNAVWQHLLNVACLNDLGFRARLDRGRAKTRKSIRYGQSERFANLQTRGKTHRIPRSLMQ